MDFSKLSGVQDCLGDGLGASICNYQRAGSRKRLFASSLGEMAVSGAPRFGATRSEASAWKSDSSVLSKVSGGVGSVRAVGITADQGRVTLSGASTLGRRHGMKV
jgi:hypothetical protein